MAIGGVFDLGEPNDPNVKVGQVYQQASGYYFIVEFVSGGFALTSCMGVKRDVLRNMFKANLADGSIRLVIDESEIAIAHLLGL
jgi:hypothetical protein